MFGNHPSSSALSLSLLGGFALRVAGADGPAIPRKGRALLAYLVMQDGKPVPRDTVAELLWRRSGMDQARHSLRQMMLVLRRDIPAIGGPALISDDGSIRLAAGAIDSDMQRFRFLAVSDAKADMIEALDLFQGPFLADFKDVSLEFDRWARKVRDDTTAIAVAVCEQLAALCARTNVPNEEIAALERMVRLAPVREDVHRRLIAAYDRAGRRGDALGQYESCVEHLRKALNLGPSAETEALIAAIKGEPVPVQNPAEGDRRRLSPTPSGGPPRLAVLPFDHFGEAALPRHVSDGLVADIVCQLAGLRELHVISHGSTLSLRERNLDVREVGRMLGARYLIRGGARRGEQALRLNTELVDTETGDVIWARATETGGTLSFADQDRIVAQVVNTLAPRVVEAELRRIRGKRPESLNVYDKALLAREHMLALNRESFQAAKPLLDDVLAVEPSWGEGQALAADWYGLVVAQGWSVHRARDIEIIERLARKALSLDGDNIRALVFYGHRKSLLHRDFPAALELFRRALDVAPSSVPAWLWSSYTFSYLGDAAEAVKRAERALALSPVDREAHRFLGALCIAHYTAGDYDTAAHWGLRALAEPSVGRTTGGWTAAALAAADRIDEAHAVAERTMARWPERRVSAIVANHPYQDPERRRIYGLHLLNAGFPA